MKKIYVVIAVFFAILLSTTVTNAQLTSPDCPDGSWTKPDNCWETEMTFPNNVVCSLYICYCYKYNSSTNQVEYMITGCSFGSACANGIEDYSTILDAAALKIVHENVQGFPCPPCPLSAYNTEVKFYPCYRRVINVTNSTENLEPCSGIGTCSKFYKVCCISGVRNVTFVSSSSSATCTGGLECFKFCP